MNDGMGNYCAKEVVKLMISKEYKTKDGNVLVMGITFKENCPDIRNSKAIDVVHELEKYNLNVDVYDPWADASEVKEVFGIDLKEKSALKENYSAVVVTVAHKDFLELDLSKYRSNTCVIFDVKSFLERDMVDGRL